MPSQTNHDDFDLKAKIRAKVEVIGREPCWEYFIYQLGVFLRESMRDHAELDEYLLKNQVERFEREKVGKGHLDPNLVDALSRSSAMRKLLPERARLDWNVNCIVSRDPGHIHLACAKMILLWTFLLHYDLATLENEILRVNNDKWDYRGLQAETVRILACFHPPVQRFEQKMTQETPEEPRRWMGLSMRYGIFELREPLNGNRTPTIFDKIQNLYVG
ncbi:hypothetical protein HD553DRAFT_325075 [Filobasidium floriforme]|uniref:uncharacterized protein n=1 Tax=Filobasidium floriforme TaxID=5210 RepID=UPI001E8CE69A|nr:uncharacterized protein HD553DRAFT_325075 [Filobasidium floriforme]KAH8082218.1 hypothetical protein HD553DRAFT_325075 [Filobasidium floriforme]